jgi:hypothetical protein
MDWLDKLSALDRRYIFVLIALAVAIPLIIPFEMPMRVSQEVQDAYDAIEQLPSGSVVLISADYDPGAMPELWPMHKALLHHIFQKKHRLINMALWPMGVNLTEEALKDVFEKGQYKATMGEDYASLGYMAGNMFVIKGIGRSFETTFKRDKRGVPLGEVPAMQGISNLRNVDLLIAVSAGFPGVPEWVQVAKDQYNVKHVIGCCTAVSAPQLYPYYPKQLSGLLGGLKAAAEYENLVGQPAAAMLGMNAQSVAHLTIILLVIIGNVTFFLQRRRSRK